MARSLLFLWAVRQLGISLAELLRRLVLRLSASACRFSAVSAYLQKTVISCRMNYNCRTEGRALTSQVQGAKGLKLVKRYKKTDRW